MSKEKLMDEIEESVNFMRKSMKRVSEIRRKNKPCYDGIKTINE